MVKFSVAFLLVVSVVQVRSLRKNPAFQQHFRRVDAFACKEPQMRALRVSDIVSTGLEGKVFVPSMTVLHRCDAGAGCCLNGDRYACGPAETEDVKLTFHVTYAVATADFKKGTVLFDTIIAQNHTRCSCIEMENLPR